jgi:arsenate reductase
MAAYYGIKVKSYSGGTEATAVYSTVIKTLQNTGFMIDKVSEGSNPTYKLNFTDENCPMTLFSKRYNDRYNPNEDYAAVMTCTDADTNCPIIPQATRISIPYVDPKVSDGKPSELETYTTRSKQIATEMKYIFLHVK